MLLLAKFNRWLQQHRITLKKLNEIQIDNFLNARWKHMLPVMREIGSQWTSSSPKQASKST